jgi:hypothetical protein
MKKHDFVRKQRTKSTGFPNGSPLSTPSFSDLRDMLEEIGGVGR